MFHVIGSPITLLCRSTSTSNTSGISPLNFQTCLYFSSVAGIKITYFMILPKRLFLFLIFCYFPSNITYYKGGRVVTHGPCMQLSLWVEDKLSYNKQSLYQFHPGTPVHSQPSRMLEGGKEAAALRNHFLSLFLSLVMTREEELLSQPCSFSSSSRARGGPSIEAQGEDPDKTQQNNPQLSKPKIFWADRDVWSLSGRVFVKMFWGLCWDTWVKQTSSYQREVFCPPQGMWLWAQLQSSHKSTLTQLLLKNKVLIFQYRDWKCYFKFRFILPLFLFTSNLPRRFSVETCQETPRLSSGSRTEATECTQCESLKDNKTYGSQFWGLAVIN